MPQADGSTLYFQRDFTLSEGERPVEGDMCTPETRPAALGAYAVARRVSTPPA